MVPLRAAADRFLAVLAGRGDGGLSQREAQVAAYLAQGLTNRQIAAAEHISERTVETHIRHIFTKLGFATRAQLARGRRPAARRSVLPISRTTDGSCADHAHATGMTTFVTPCGPGRRLPRCVPPACSTAPARCPTRP